jgi:hypothetical protein
MKRNKTLIFILFLSFLAKTNVHAALEQVPCLKRNNGIGLQGLDKYACILAEKVANDPKNKNEFEAKINKKLADKLYIKASERLEEITILDRYFDQIGLDFGKKASRVTTSCKLEVIANPNCGRVKNVASYEQKLKLLSSNFPISEEAAKVGKNENLIDRMRNRSNQIRGATNTSPGQCPVSGSTGRFFLTSQFSDNAAEKFIENLKVNDTEPVKNFYNNYPQFKMLKQNASKDGSAFLNYFESEMKKYSPKLGSQKKFMEDFFFSERTQDQLTNALADKCETIASDIKDYLCKDLDHLGMPEDTAADFFDDSEADLKLAKDFSCRYKTDTNEEDLAALMKGESPGARFEQFKSDRKTVKKLDISIAVDPFCKMYTCQDDKVKTMKSCQKGGPVTSGDLVNTCNEGKINNCDLGMQRYITYLKTLEKDIQITHGPTSSLASTPGEEAKKPKGFSSFYQNFMGVEGTILAEGKKITPVTLEEKRAEFVEKKLDTTVQPASLSQSRSLAKAEPQQRDVIIQKMDRSDNVISNTDFSTRDNVDQYKRSIATTQFAKPSDTSITSSSRSKKYDSSESDNQNMDEMKKLRTELADAISKVKGTEEQKLATVAANNASIASPSGTTSSKDVTRNLGQGEKERLDSYRNSLKNWESRLGTWQNQLSDREVRANSSTGPVANSEQSLASANSMNGVKLTKVAVAGAAKADGAATADKAPGAEKADIVAGIVNSDKLATLQLDSLKKLGIVASDSFIIKVRFQDKIYAIPVKTFSHDGKTMFVPVLNEKNRELAKIVFDSPLFRDYRDYQLGLQNKIGQR